MKTAHYDVVNTSGNLLKAFGAGKSALHAARKYVKENEGCGLRYGLRIKKYYVKSN